MSDERLLAGDVTDLERQLLRSWEDEQPSAEARNKALVVAGLGLAPVAASLKGAASAALPKTMVLGTIAKLGAMIVLIAVAGGALALRRPAAPVRAPSSSTTQVIEAPQSTMAPDPAPIRGASPALQPHAHARPHASSALGEQVAALDHIRTALRGGDAGNAKRLVDEYEAKFPGGSLREEAEALRVEALIALGERAEARRVANRFFAAYPNSPHARRLRALLEPATP